MSTETAIPVPAESIVSAPGIPVLKEPATDSTLPVDRQSLIDTAVKFLQNPKVIPTSSENKRAFLRKKGLTEAEIEQAFKKSGTSDTAPASTSSQLPSRPVNEQQFVASKQEISVQKPPSMWSTVFKWIKTFLFAGCLAYTAYKLLVKKYLFGSLSAKQRAADSEKIIKANEQLQKSVQEMRTSLSSLKETVELMNNVVTQFVTQKAMIGASDESAIKNEVQSIKNLLLGRNQFPSLPTVSPVIPSWQLESSKVSKPKSPNDDPVIISSSDVSTNGQISQQEEKKAAEASS